MLTAQCRIKLQNVQVSDTTEADSSNAADPKKYLLFFING